MKFAKYILAAAAVLSCSSAFAIGDADVKWPDADSGWLKKGTFIDVEQLRRIGPGMNKDQVRELISYPQFSEGFFHPRAWNYLFNFRTGKGYEYVTCQYQVYFDKHEDVESMHWRNPECAKFLEVAKPAPVAHPLTLSSDGLFAFGKSGFNDLQETGRRNLTELASQMKNGYSNLRSVEVVGFTDRIGRMDSNMALSIARANTVKQYLVSQGIDGSKIRTSGMGPNKPVTFCDGAATPAVIQCLMPNRRIEITVSGDK